jgi:hypothetical protein
MVRLVVQQALDCMRVFQAAELAQFGGRKAGVRINH